MNLEDRIKHTGEHFLGTFHPDPALPDRIEQRVAVRIRRRRQFTAAGLGVGVVVVMGGLVVAQLDRSGPETPIAAAPDIGPLVPTVVTDPPMSNAASTSMVRSASTSAAPVTPSTTVTAPPATVVQPIADDAPPLFTMWAGADVVQRIDLSTGVPQDTTMSSLGSWTQPAGAAAGSYQLDYGADATNRDRCGQYPLGAPGVDLTSESVQIPRFASAVTMSPDGTTGLIDYAVCPEQGTLADGPTTQPIERRTARFTPSDPLAPLVPVQLADGSRELSSDGRYVAVEHDGTVEIIEVASSTVVPAVPSGCSTAKPDSATGYLLGSDGFASLVWCDGTATLLAGTIGALDVHPLQACGEHSELAVLDGEQPDAAVNWFAVHDPDAELAWIVSGHGVSEPVPVGAEVSWYAAGT